MNRPKKIPLRKCIVTLEQHPKKEMFRIVRTPDGEIVVDDNGKTRGRGAYIVKNKTAILEAKKRQLLDKHLEAKVPDSLFEELLKLIGDTVDK